MNGFGLAFAGMCLYLTFLLIKTAPWWDTDSDLSSSAADDPVDPSTIEGPDCGLDQKASENNEDDVVDDSI